jgi:Homotrimeric ring hydroxylase
VQSFYERDGWSQENLCAFDDATIVWRKIAARFNRGIQESPYRRVTR